MARILISQTHRKHLCCESTGLPHWLVIAITRRRRIAISFAIPGTNGSGSSTTPLSVTSNILISRQSFIVFFIFTFIVSLNGRLLSPSFCFSLQLPVLPLGLEILPTLRFFLLSNPIVDHRTGENDESSHISCKLAGGKWYRS